MCNDQIRLAKTVEFDFSIQYGTTPTFGDTHITKEKLFEFDYSGVLMHSYSIPKASFHFRFIEDTKFLLLHCSIRIIKLGNGNHFTVKEIQGFDDDQLNDQESTSFTVDYPIKRFGDIFIQLKTDQSIQLFQMRTEKLIFESSTLGFLNRVHTLNWNLYEIGVTFSKKAYDKELFIKILRSDTRGQQMSLKNFARLTVLTSFVRRYLDL